MRFVKLSSCINCESRLYGLKLIGLLFGLIFMIIIWANSSIIFGIIAGSTGYFLGDIVSKYYYAGTIQKLAYWKISKFTKLPLSRLPDSSKRKLL